MGMIERVLNLVFGGERNIVRDTVEVFRENAETGAVRDAATQQHALDQYADEFRSPSAGRFDRFMDGVNRLPRPALALGTLGLFVSAMIAPLWFAQRMQGIALVPEPLWWLLGVIVSFYFGARHQVKSQHFQRSIVETVTRAPQVAANIVTLGEMRSDAVGVADTGSDARLEVQAVRADDNPALRAWAAAR